MKDEYAIVNYPILSEKGTRLSQDENKYVFRVSRGANKIEVKRAIEKLYKVRVKDVNTMNVKGKRKRMGLMVGKRPDWKKAIVTLEEGETLSFV
ncbi:MAG: 50S ribosomal protein L23 [Acidobacteriota bacterium]